MALFNYMTNGWATFDGVTLNKADRTVTRRYYYAGGQRVAVRVENDPLPANNGLFFLLGDHLGSTSLTLDSSGNQLAELRYKAWGDTRDSGFSETATPTDYRFTGQRLDSYINIYWYGSRWYDPALGRWIQPDPIIPDPYNPLDWDRYSYTRNNPVKYIDPSGHMVACGTDSGNGCEGFGPARILETYGGYDEDGRDQALRNFARSRKNYSISNDPFLDDTGRFFTANAQFQAAAEDSEYDHAWSYGISFGILGVIQGSLNKDGPPVGPGIIYRAGRANPGNLKPRPLDEGMLSFRDSLSNPWPMEQGQRPVFSPGDDFIAVDSHRLPAGSVIFDNEPPGHVSINGFLASVEAIKNAVLGIFRFP